jgi:Protein of unknown function (DUF3703)
MTRFAHRIRAAVQAELDAARDADARGEPDVAFRHLERAHVLGQAATALHVRVHWRMFVWAARQRKPSEGAGQLARLVAAALVTAVGWLPHGNTGGADVSAFRRMPIPDDLQRVIDAARR